MKYDIFISYRRDGGDTLAQLIYDRLTDRGYSVFLDIESLRSGKFNEKLFSVIDECRDVVVILPPDSLERCRNEGDWLFLELTHALQERKNIIPVMMKGFEWPDDMPEGLEELPDFNGIQDSKDYFDAVIDKMTTLLQSRPVLFGAVRKKLHKKKPHFDIRTKIKKRKKLLIGFGVLAAAVILAAAAALYFPKRHQEQQLEAASEDVDIMIYPGDDMSASEYYGAQDTLKQRFDILADGVDYEYTVRDDTIHVVIPEEVFHEISPETVLKSYVTRPGKLSVTGGFGGEKKAEEQMEDQMEEQTAEDEEYVDVCPDDIISLEKKTGTGEEIQISRIDKELYGLEDADEYQYLEITFSDEVCRNMRKQYGEQEIYQLAQDVEEVGIDNAYGYWMLTSDTPDTFYLVDNFQADNLSGLLEFNLRQEPFASSFRFNYLQPVDWEFLSGTENPGENQRNIWDIEQPYITMQFSCSEEEISAGEMQDYMAGLRRRLDALDMPYAIGRTTDPEHEFDLTIRTGTGHLGGDITGILFSSFGLSVEGVYYDVIDSYYVEDLKYEKKDDGTYQFSLILNEDFESEWNMEDYETKIDEIAASENHTLYLMLDSDYRLAEADVSEDVDGTRITFDNLCYLGLDTISEGDLYLLDLLKELAQTPDMSSGSTDHSLENYRIDGENSEDFGVESIAESMVENEREAIRSVWPDADVTGHYAGYNDTINAELELEADDTFPQKANEAIQKIYGASGLASGEIDYMNITIYAGEDGRISFTIDSSNNYHYMVYSGHYSGESIKPYQEEFGRILQNDPFYTETVRKASDTAWTYYYD